MDIFEVLRADHREVRDLMNKLIEQTSEQRTLEENWPETLYDLKTTLWAHNRAEKEIIYDRLPDQDFADQSLAEHLEAESLLSDLDEMRPQDEVWPNVLALLKNTFEAHLSEEESRGFALLESIIDQRQRHLLARLFEQCRDDLMERMPTFAPGRSAKNPAGLNLHGEH